MLKHWSGLEAGVCPSGEKLCSWVSDSFPLFKPIFPSALLASLFPLALVLLWGVGQGI